MYTVFSIARCQEGEDDFEIDGEKELDSFIDIVKVGTCIQIVLRL